MKITTDIVKFQKTTAKIIIVIVSQTTVNAVVIQKPKTNVKPAVKRARILLVIADAITTIKTVKSQKSCSPSVRQC